MTARSARPVVIVGSGFAGTVLARALNARGREVMLIERGAHPRFALGESSTPLASICLERLAATYGLPDLLALSAYGRWNRELPSVRHGLKRGFSFYAHQPGHEYRNGPTNEARLLVAASPDDEIADSHWLRADVDHHLAQRAVDEGVELVDRCEVRGADRTSYGWRLRAVRAGRPMDIEAAFVVDATGGAGISGLDDKKTPHATMRSRPPDTGLIFGHFTDVRPLVETALDASFDAPPYPEERAAVHHLLDEGWMYVLRFDDGLVSAGIVIDRAHADANRLLSVAPAEAWSAALERYPTLREQFDRAVPVRPVATQPHLQRRSRAAAGPDWAALPHAYAFASPMFSTGIAWSLLGVERLAFALTDADQSSDTSLREYDRLLATEADHIAGLVSPTYALRRDFDAFAAWTQVYFTAASYHEALQRLADPPTENGWLSSGFLGACDPALRTASSELAKMLGAERTGHSIERRSEAWRADSGDALLGMVGDRLGARNLAGLADPTRNRSYPVDLEALIRCADLIGLSEGEARERLPRLRGPVLNAKDS